MHYLFVTLGISGSGKSTAIKHYQEQRAKNGLKPILVVCPDDIRRELTGSVSDQTQNSKVFYLAYQRVREALQAGQSVIFDSTALNSKTRKELREIGLETGAHVILWVLTDSRNPELCRSRVIGDIKSGIDRADTCRQDIIDRMYQSYKSALSTIETEGYESIVYL